jgi:hypothetical protein
LQLKREVDLLRQELSDKQKELSDLKEGVKVAMQGSSLTDQGENKHYANLLENQSRELCRIRRLLDEHEKRER